MSKWSRGFAMAALAALIGMLAIATTSSAHKRLFNTTATITLAKATASGQIGGSGACRANRTVILFEDKDPNVIGDTAEIGRTTSTATGAWSIPAQGSVKAGRIYNVLAKKKLVLKNSKHKHVCKSALSENVTGT